MYSRIEGFKDIFTLVKIKLGQKNKNKTKQNKKKQNKQNKTKQKQKPFCRFLRNKMFSQKYLL